MAAPFPSPTKIWHTNTYPSISPSRPQLSAKEKTIVITGGGTGIGAATAHAFAEAGASRIALLGRREIPLQETKASIHNRFPSAEIKVLTFPVDITKQEDVDKVFLEIGQEGPVDTLVSGASIIGPQEFIDRVDVNTFIDAVGQNLKGTMNIAQAFLRCAAKDATVVEINSNSAHVNFGKMTTCYNVSKIATFKVWDTVTFGWPEMSVFHIQPGVVNTAMNREVGGVKALGFEDHASLPANFILWLSSKEARFLNGKFLWANWDVDELIAQKDEIDKTRKFNLELVGWPFGGQEYESTWKSA